MNLFLLAPQIQVEVLHLPAVTEGKDSIPEKLLRPIAAEVCFQRQRLRWITISKSHLAKD